MVLGYNEKRPNRENYESFVEKLDNLLKIFKKNDLSLMLYGSYVRGDYNPGRSDIDAVLVFSDDVIIDKLKMNKFSKILACAEQDNNIPFQVTVCDLTTMRDGKFNSFDPNFKNYFDEEGKIIFGSDYRNDFSYSLADNSDQNALRFNLRKSRMGLLFFETDKLNNYEKVLEKFNKTLNAVSRASKQILGMIDGNLRKNRFSALEELSKIFPDLDTNPLKKIKNLYHNLEDLDKLYRNVDELKIVWEDSINFFESLIKNYLELKK